MCLEWGGMGHSPASPCLFLHGTPHIPCSFSFQFNWHGIPDREKKRRTKAIDPVRYALLFIIVKEEI